MKQTLWTKKFSLLITATTLGCIGNIISSFALSFLVFDETGSTFASALVIAIQLIPNFLIPLLAAPWMDRLPRKPFLVFGDLMNGILYALMGLYLLFFDFSYIGYLGYSLLLATLGSLDELAYNSIFPKVIPNGMEQKGYAVSSMLYPILRVVTLPITAVLMDILGIPWLFIGQGMFSICAALVENQIQLEEKIRMNGTGFSFKIWKEDIAEVLHYLKTEKGLQAVYSYMAVSNGVSTGYTPVLVAFFRTAPGMSAALYSLFSIAEFLGRTIGGFVQYHIQIPTEKKYHVTFGIYTIYELMDMSLLWLPYPLMLANRTITGFLGTNSATLRVAAVQTYIPEQMRARVNAFENMIIMAISSICSVLVGAIGEILDYRLCITLCSAFALLVCMCTIFRYRTDIKKIYETEENLREIT